MEKSSSRIYRFLGAIILAGLCAAVSGCASGGSGIPLFGRSDKQAGESTEASTRRSSRAEASLQLTEEGRELLQARRPDDAIRVLEQSVGLDPTNGQSYYYLAEAWLMKGNLAQAEEFNRQARLYLKDSVKGARRVAEQKAWIEILKGQRNERE